MKTLTLPDLLQIHKSADFVHNSIAYFRDNAEGKLHVPKLIGSSTAFFLSNLYSALDKSILIIYEDQEDAFYILNELEKIHNKELVLFFPPSHRRPYEIVETNNANVVLRTEVLNRLSTSTQPRIIVTTSNALTEKVVIKSVLASKTQRLKVGEQISVDFLNEVLFDYGFKRVDFVTEPGEFSVRGGIIDIFSYADEEPYRISFFGDEIESIRKFNIGTQLSIVRVDEFRIVPNIENKFVNEKRQSFIEFLPKDCLLVTQNISIAQSQLKKNFQKAEASFVEHSGEIKRSEPSDIFLQDLEFIKAVRSKGLIELSSESYTKIEKKIEVHQSPQPAFHKKFGLLIDVLQEQVKNDYTNYLVCSSEKQIERLQDIFEENGREVKYTAVLADIHEGFIDKDLKIACFTDHEIFERYHRFNLRDNFTKKESITLKELTNLQIGDFVTHIDHGIGKFGGLKRIDVNGTMQEAIKLLYKDNDLLYVSIHSLHKISKFSSKDAQQPKINKLGSPAWKNLKTKTKKKVKDVAFDLIKLYAKRRLEKGFSFTPDTYLQHELEASFMYEDTPDQITATEDVKADMESEQVMDRLIVGDVGFGKTEIAIRAAFKAATDGKQVAILVPTTILAFQHYKTFNERLEDFPVRVEYLNRFKSTKQKNEILKDLADGKIDILIGTHQIVGKKVLYKDLGLLIVDEEHKFGVSIKDKLKTLRARLDTLTLTATPIPRTLQFSLMAARDLSIIKTPPPNRQPVETKIIGLNEEQIRDAVFYEIQRGGQVFIIFNRIEGLTEMSGMIQRLVPEAKIAIGHGQMDGKKLEKTLLDFIDGKFDVLVSTTIIENGVDVANANTMLILDAQNFGLADLHQMRGRVGRSNRKAFCYLITPPLVTLTSEARKRLQAIEQFTELGSGFNIAMKDLEIRGAGNLLGAEQSGFMADMGFDTYQKILNEAIEELKHSPEFVELFGEENDANKGFVSDFTLDTDLELLLPPSYVNSVEERMALYNELSKIEEEKDLAIFDSKLKDRFGDLPLEAQDLLESVKLKWQAEKLGMERVIMKNNVFHGYFINNPQSAFYKTETFQRVIAFLGQNPKFGTLKEKQLRGNDLPTLILTIKGVHNIEEAMSKLNQIISVL